MIQARVMCVYSSIKPLFLIRISEGWRFENGWYQWWWRDCLQLDNLGGWRRAAFLWVLDRYEGISTKYHCATTWTSFRGDESNPVCGLQFLMLTHFYFCNGSDITMYDIRDQQLFHWCRSFLKRLDTTVEIHVWPTMV